MAHASEKRILIVDDEPDVRNFLAACIGDAGFVVETAEDGLDALEKIKKNVPDLMTVDMLMPRRSGIGLIRKLRKNEKWADIPVIVITAHAHDEFGSDDIKKFNGFATHHRPRYIMEKPITPKRIIKAISEILDVDADSDVSARSDQSSEREAVINMIKGADDDTLKKIREMLNQ